MDALMKNVFSYSHLSVPVAACVFLFLLVFSHVAWGGDEIYYIDRDGDGYGVGVGYVVGPDADDNDPKVNTPQSVLEKYGTLDAFLAAKGYDIKRKLFISTTGNDATAAVDDISRPYATWSKVKKIVRPGDAVIYREGVYQKGISAKNFGGTRELPILIMAYPGETVTFINCGKGSNGAAINIKGGWHLVFDGLIFNNQMHPGDGNGIYLNGSTSWDWKPVEDVAIRNVEAMNTKSGLRAMVNIHDLLVENCVVHDTSSHNIYWGTSDNEQPNSDLTLRDSILYKGAKAYKGRHCLQHNGVAVGLKIENNICHSTVKGGGISIENGASHSLIRNNLIFNTSKMGIQFFAYKAKWGAPMSNNVVINNTIWIGHNSITGSEEPKDHSGILIKDSTGKLPIEYTEIRNNIIYTQNGCPIQISSEALGKTTIITNNVLYRAANESDKFLLWSGKTAAKIGDEKISIGALNGISDFTRNNILADPLFKQASINDYETPRKFDFELFKGSPARKLALQISGAPQFDLKGRKRPSHPNDAGCYEYQNENLPPEFKKINGNIISVANKPITIPLSAVDPDGQTLRFSCLNPPRGSVIKGSLFSWIPDMSQLGKHNLLFKVTDGISGDTLMVPVRVLEPDQNCPKILSVKAVGVNSVLISIDKAVKKDVAETIDNYSITPHIGVTGAEYNDNTNVLILHTSPQTMGGEYAITIKNLEDFSGNVMPNTKVQYHFNPLIGHWKFDEGAGNSVHDASGNSFTGTVVGAKWVPGKSGHALLFDGKNEFVRISPMKRFDTVQEFSIAAWIKWNGMSRKRYQGIVFKKDLYDLMLDKNTIVYSLNGKFKAFSKIKPGVWYHIVCTYRAGGEMKLYLNAKCVAHRYKIKHPLRDHGGDLYIGARIGGRSNHFNGIIDDVRLYHAELQPSDVVGLYNEASP
jgi:Concanavalin A-like lectin/glucanases superfamily/Right handed beta helix region